MSSYKVKKTHAVYPRLCKYNLRNLWNFETMRFFIVAWTITFLCLMSCFLFNALNYVFWQQRNHHLTYMYIIWCHSFRFKICGSQKFCNQLQLTNSIMLNIVYGSGIFSVVQYKNDQTKYSCSYRNTISWPYSVLGVS